MATMSRVSDDEPQSAGSPQKRYRAFKRHQLGNVKRYKCMECGEIFYLVNVLTRHLAEHGDEEFKNSVTYWCEDCEEEFPNMEVLDQHGDEFHSSDEDESSDEEALFGAPSTLQKGIEERDRAERERMAAGGERKMWSIRDYQNGSVGLLDRLREKEGGKWKRLFALYKDKSDDELLQMVLRDDFGEAIDDFCAGHNDDSGDSDFDTDEEEDCFYSQYCQDLLDAEMEKSRVKKVNSDKPVIHIDDTKKKRWNYIERYFSERCAVKDRSYKTSPTVYLMKRRKRN